MEALFDVADVAVNGSRRSRHETAAYGAVAEQLAIAELLKRDRRVAVPVVDDDGVDLVVDYRVRVQVKNAYRRPTEVKAGFTYQTYSWRSQRGWSSADVFLFLGELDARSRWWVVPSWVLEGHGSTLSLYEGLGLRAGHYSRPLAARAAVVSQYEDAWHVFDGF